MNRLPLSPEELEKQSPIKIDEWVDIDSPKALELDPDHKLTKKWLKIGFEDKFLFTDSRGQIWGRGNDGRFFPYHFNVGKKLYGFRLSTLASN
jgi:hypothetical protein